MKKDSYSQLFSDYRPPLAPAADFMRQLNLGLDSVAAIKRQEGAMSRRRRLALAVAFVAGLLTGVAGTICLPYMVDLFSAVSLPEINLLPSLPMPLLPLVLSWIVIGGASILIAMQGYGVASTLMDARKPS